ncbi:hypothetical protein ACFRJ1_15975 [Streptomyces sp. NPDC056773]|uniref:hypothetical protein n=1 Tax=unclassified Streptomyces TaxID=2593676 RepID=UPI0036C101EF
MVPENFSAEGDETGGHGRLPEFSVELAALYAAAGGGKQLTLKDLVERGVPHGFKVADSTLSGWLTGASVPMQERHVRYVLNLLIPFLESRAAQRSKAHRRTEPETWRARLVAAQAVRKSGQGGRGARIGAASPGRLFGMPSRALQDVLPHEFVGRDAELDELAAFPVAPDGDPAYVWWQADAWAGKTALLAWFATRRLPAGVDAVHHFISGRLGRNRREDFLLALGEQLASVVGRKLRVSERGRPESLPALFEAAAKASAGRHRRLLLIVDGLDEDADAAPGGMSIAALLPKQPPYGMRVIVSGRANPQVPQDVAQDHPLRDPGIVRRLAASPAAHVIRDMALQELNALLDDERVGSPLLGLLVAAQGALTGADLAELAEVRPHDVGKRLRSVVGRNMVPTDHDDLALGAARDPGDAAAKQTFVLAHEELYRAAAAALGKRELAGYAARLHAWADEYRNRDWPEDTPNYLLTGYTRLVRQGGDTDRLADLVLDPWRQRRLVRGAGADVALADLALLSPSDGEGPLPSLVTAARAAMSREWLLPHTRPLPRSVVRTVARLGDVGRARALAGASPDARAKAAYLADVAHVLAEMGHKEAADTAREAGEWARTALREAGSSGYEGDEVVAGAEAAAGRAALALMATDQVAAGLELLRAIRGSSTARYGAWAEAAVFLEPDHPESAAELLDALEDEAADLAEDPGEDPEDGSAAVAVQIWQTVTTADPDRTDRLQERILEHAHAVWDAAPTLESVSVLAGAASALAQDRPEEAMSLASLAHRHVVALLLSGTGPPLSPADAFHLEFGFRHTLARLATALTDIGMPEDQVGRRLLEPLEQLLPGGPAGWSEELGDVDVDADVDEGGVDPEAERLAEEAFGLAVLGKDRDARSRLNAALALLPAAGPGTGLAPRWLPSLAAAVVRADAADDTEPLLAPWQDPADRARAYAAMAMAYADLDRLDDARRSAHRAAQAAGGSTPDSTWAHVAQALACAGEGEAAEALLGHQTAPTDRSKKAEWKRAIRLARIAVAAGLAERDRERADRLLFPLVEDLHTSRDAPQGMSKLLVGLAAILPAVTGTGADDEHPYAALLQEVQDIGLDYADRKDPNTWQPETVLVHALLRIGAGEDPSRQLDWLTRHLANRGPEHFPTAALAVVHAAYGDAEAARRVADLLTDPRARAVALTAVAGHLARFPVHPLPEPDPTAQPDPFTRTVQHLALEVTSHTPPDHGAAGSFLHSALSTTGWHHVLPVLALVEPEAVAGVRDTAVVHTRAAGL